MNHKIFARYTVLLFGWIAFSQTPDSSYVYIDTTQVVITKNEIQNAKILIPFFKKLDSLKTDQRKKINIVHIGDSHIQADIFSGTIRRNLQQFFGNGGRGFVFPYSIAKTNGSPDIKFSTNITWSSQRNIYPNEGNPVGLSGIALYTSAPTFVMDLTSKQRENDFNTIKIITPQNKKMFDIATATKTIIIESEVPKKIIHTIKRGEAISIIADKYNISMAELKAANGLKSNSIRAGKTLQIPTKEKVTKNIERSEFLTLGMLSTDKFYYYTSDKSIDKLYLLPDKEATNFALNGLVLENNNAGVVYHSIGVNGAKCSDYTKFPLFFEQLPALQPDLIILSLGTNESFDKLEAPDFLLQLNLFLDTLKKSNPNALILVMTPPPSQFKRRFPNTFVANYTKDILFQAEEKNTAVWDLFSLMGGLFGVDQNFKESIISLDRVHYTQSGYRMQGELFTDALLKAYANYKIQSK